MTSPWSSQDIRVDGFSLKTWGYGIEVVDGLSGIPGMRGQNDIISYRRGERWHRKPYTAMNRAITMWIDNRDPITGLAPSVASPYTNLSDRVIAQHNENVAEVMRIFAREDRLLSIERDVLLADGMQTWTGLAEVATGARVTPSTDFYDLAAFQVELNFVEGFWRGPQVTASCSPGGSMTVYNPGEATCVDALISFVGPMGSGFYLENTSGALVSDLGINKDLGSGDHIYVDCGSRRAGWDNPPTGGDNDVLQAPGSRDWMPLYPGDNVIYFGGSGSGTATIYFYPPRA